jgi:hypothetical protein
MSDLGIKMLSMLETSPPLDGSNYDQWSATFLHCLTNLGIEDAIVEPADGEEIGPSRRERNAICYSALALAVTDPDCDLLEYQAKSTRFSEDGEETCGDAPLAWRLLRDRCNPPVRGIDVITTWSTFCRLRMDDPSADPGGFVDELVELQRKLQGMGQTVEDGHVMFQVLEGLPKQYNYTVRTLHVNWETQTIASIRGALQEVYRRDLQRARPKKFAGRCNHCGRHGHKKVNCYAWKRAQTRNTKVVPVLAATDTALCAFPMDDEGEISISDTIWIGVLSASCHMTRTLAGMTDVKDASPHDRVLFGNGDSLKIAKVGSWKGTRILPDGSEERVKLTNVKYVPGLAYNLFSQSAAMRQGWNLSNDGTVLQLTKGLGTVRFDQQIKCADGYVSGVQLHPVGGARRRQ